MMCPHCASPNLTVVPIYYDASVGDLIDYYEYTCDECQFTFMVKA